MTQSHRDAKHCDVAIIGGGPAGAAAATALAKRGISVLVCERERFPRFHVGESLLPYQTDVLERLGVFDKIDCADFVPKLGAFFVSNDGTCQSEVDFRRFLPKRCSYAFQVERAKFDDLLLRHAADCGATVLEGHSVVEAELEAERCRLQLRDEEGRPTEVTCRWVLDASGQGSFLARRLGLRNNAPDLRKVAHFAHFRGGKAREGAHAGHITILLGQGCWFWHIPLSAEHSSVGCVVDRDRWAASDLEPDAFLGAMIATSPWLAGWLEGAERITPTHTVANFSYTSSSFAGSGWTLVGDAATFLDPIFSTGVLLALRSGEAAAEVIANRIERGLPLTEKAFDTYQRQLRQWTGAYFTLIRAFYQPQFPAILFNPVVLFQWPLTQFLAGRLELPWFHRMVVWLFLRIVELNKSFRIVPEPRSAEAAVPHG